MSFWWIQANARAPTSPRFFPLLTPPSRDSFTSHSICLILLLIITDALHHPSPRSVEMIRYFVFFALQLAFFCLLFWSAFKPTDYASESGTLSLRTDLPDFTFDYNTDFEDSSNWIGLYHAKSGGPKKGKYIKDSLAWEYAPGNNGTVQLQASSLEPGNYEAFFLAKGGYEWLADPVAVYRKPDPVAFYTDAVTLHNARVGDEFSANLTGLLGGGGGDVTVDYSITASRGGDWLKVSSEGRLFGTPKSARHQTARVVVTASASDNSTSDLVVTVPVAASGAPLVEYLNVLTYNMWFGGSKVNNYHAKQVAFLASSNFDIVVLQESWGGQAHRLGHALGWYSWQGVNSASIISRYPIVERYPQKNHGGAVRIALDGEDLEINVWGVHLAYTPYGPYDFCYENMTVDEVMARERNSGREGQIKETVGLMKKHLDNSDRVPVILAGDFNAPSHLDWTKENSDEHCGAGDVPWPTSKVPVDAGLLDSFRTVHPDPARKPGYTWSPIYLDNEGRPEPLDRIDIIYHKGPMKVYWADKFIVGHPSPQPHHWENEWTSDHAAMLAKYDLRSFVKAKKLGDLGANDAPMDL